MANFLKSNGGTPVPNAATQNLANVVRSFKGINNPQQLMQKMGGNNAQMQQVQQLMRSGKNPKDLAMSLMQKNGIDFNQFMSMMNGG